MTVGERVNGVPKGVETVLFYLKLFFPMIQPGSTKDMSSVKIINTFINSMFKATFYLIQKEIEDLEKKKRSEFIFINPASETRLTDTPIIHQIMSFYLEFFYYVLFACGL